MAKTVKRLVLPPALGSYAFIWKPRDPPANSRAGAKPKYSISLIWPKAEKEKLRELNNAIIDVARARFGLDTDGKPVDVTDLLKRGKLHNPLRDGDVDRPEDKVYRGSYFATASSERAPGIVNRQNKRVFGEQSEEEAYSGCTYRVKVALFAYDTQGNKGVALGLDNMQVVAKGPRLDGRKPPEEDFAEYAEQGEAGGGSRAAGNDDLLG